MKIELRQERTPPIIGLGGMETMDTTFICIYHFPIRVKPMP